MFLSLMLTLMIVLSALEHMLPPLPLLPPSVKLGLANIVTMYCVFFVKKTEAIGLNVLKSFFVFLTRGPMAGLLSFCGGMMSIGIIILLVIAFKSKISYITLSISGAVAHNLGQLAAVSFILDVSYLYYYLPVLLVSGVLMGIITGTVLKVIMPVFGNVFT